ncbi:MAG: dienelactone hydrolase family protein [Bacteroidota bacterium]
MKPFSILILAFLSLHLSAQNRFVKALSDSPRHHEWAEVTYGDRTVECFVAFPEKSEPTAAVILIHENRGLNDWARLMADELAGAGFLVIAPDLLTGAGPDGGKTTDFASTDDARKAIYGLDADQVTQDLQAVENYAREIPACNGKVAVIGFCWGGSQTFRYATNSPTIATACVFYGTGPKAAEPYAQIQAPVYGFYGGNDARVNATIDHSATQMKANDNSYDRMIFEGAGHAFMRRGATPDGGDANIRAREAAFDRLVEILSGL